MATSGKGGKSLVADRRYITQKPASTGGRGTPPPKKPTPSKATTRRSGNILTRFFGAIWRIIWGTFWRISAVCGMVLAGIVFYFYQQLPPVNALLDGRAKGSVTLLDRNDTVFAWRGETFGGQITADTVSPYLLHAVIATEDKRFYQHFGVSPRGIASAISINLAAGRGPLEGNGGSTITQQVAKLLCLGVPYDPKAWKSEADYEADCRSGGVKRKLKEIPYAIAMEAKYTKEEILTIYFNRAYLGAGARGFEAAAQRYFGTSANDLTPAQAAMLAGLLKAPSRYAPTNSLKRAQDRADVIIDLMAEQGYLTPEEAADAHANPAQLSDAAQTKSGGFFADWVMETAPDFLTSTTTEDVVMRTTLDQKLQRDAEEALAWVFDNKVAKGSKAQAAIVVMSADGAVRAMVGGRKTESAGAFNRATQALRQTGSSFKPFVYAAALDLGWSPSDYVEDVPLTMNIPGSGKWTPDNYDRKFKGLITLTQALEESRNIPAVKVSEAVGREAVRKIALGFGIQSDLAAGPALALGASESTLIEMTGAYAGILNGGSSVTPYGLVELKLKGEEESLMGAGGGIGERVISENAAKLLTFMMAKVVESGTGTRARLEGRPAAGKTGTTSAARDAWFIGFTADYVAGVWIGYDDNTPLKGVTGGGLPAEIWHEVMTRVEDGVPVTELPLTIPEYRKPPNGGYASDQPVDPNAENPAYQQEPSEPLMNPSDDQVEALLKDILNGKGN
ncbi:glycosyl transferase family 51 [Cypionkella aquatica]|uniref:peptidoglycan glycosyltransferase n=1 Tax=Cypionkella aquatica TaxID=1756042 RepID=A0AA37TNU5_9RHOB|nr:PBP1A family penicillin-binding protein [Cypionkella aquatica]GLS85259.1 glycosyl transferase family 51 [Cypionkella aquatica]